MTSSLRLVTFTCFAAHFSERPYVAPSTHLASRQWQYAQNDPQILKSSVWFCQNERDRVWGPCEFTECQTGEERHRGNPNSSVFSASFDQSSFFIPFLPGLGHRHLWPELLYLLPDYFSHIYFFLMVVLSNWHTMKFPRFKDSWTAFSKFDKLHNHHHHSPIFEHFHHPHGPLSLFTVNPCSHPHSQVPWGTTNQLSFSLAFSEHFL